MLQMLFQQGWLSYRQKLRDPPSVMESRGYEPWQAVMMFPVMPQKDMRDPDARRSQIPTEMVLLQLMYKLPHKKPPVRNNTIKIIIN